MKKFDLIVIGAGSGGLTCAIGGRLMGASVLLIEKHKIGGDCLNYGCVPSKAIIHAANLAESVRQAKRFGVEADLAQINFDQVIERVQSVITGIATEHESRAPLEAQGIVLEEGEATFTGTKTLTVNGQQYMGKAIVLATGGRAQIPGIAGLSEVPYLTNEQVFSKKDLGEKVVILGGGPIGSEMAMALHRLGKSVTIVDRGQQLLGREDKEAGALMTQIFMQEGIDVRLGLSPARVKKTESGIEVVLADKDGKEQNIQTDELLIALGRRPNVEGLGLEMAGVRYSPKGVVVDEYQRTSNPNVYACGDICGPYQFTHLANYQGGLILRNAFTPFKKKANLSALPRCTFVDPEVASVGKTEDELIKSGVKFRKYKYDVAELDRARAEGATAGFIKVLTTPKGQILGAVVVSQRAGEVIQELVFAMKYGHRLQDVYGTTHAYPTWAELARYAGFVQFESSLTPMIRRLLRWWNGFHG